MVQRTVVEGTEVEGLWFIPISRLQPSRENPRRSVGDISELAASIKSQGVLEPLLVTPNGDGTYEVVCGSRRLAAAKEAGLSEVPAIVRELDEKARAEIILIENLQREDLTPLEEARAYKRLLALGYSQHQLAERIGRGQSHISKRLSLLELPDKAQKALDSGRITIEDALALTRLVELPKRLEAAMARQGFHSGAPMSEVVEHQLREHRTETKRNQAIQRLKAEGIKVIALKQYEWRIPGEKIGEEAYDRTFRGIDPKEHAKEPCHAVVVTWEADIIPLCLNPKRHRKEGDSQLRTGLSKKERETRKRKIDHNRARRDAQTKRTEFMQKLLAQRLGYEEVSGGLVRALLDYHGNWYGKALEIAAQLLGIPIGADLYQYRGTRMKDVLRLAQKGDKELRRVALALAFGLAEQPLREQFPDFKAAKGHFDFLAKHSYQVSPAEKLELAGKAPR